MGNTVQRDSAMNRWWSMLDSTVLVEDLRILTDMMSMINVGEVMGHTFSTNSEESAWLLMM